MSIKNLFSKPQKMKNEQNSSIDHEFTSNRLVTSLRAEFHIWINCHAPKTDERRKRSGVEDVMYNIKTMQSSKQATTSSIALII